MSRLISIERETKETKILLALDMEVKKEPDLAVEGVPFFTHLLHAMSFHGRFFLSCKASGDIDVDPHHLVEDIGLVLGEALYKTVAEFGPVKRFAHAFIPMDDALSEVVLDSAGRSFLVFNADFPQEYAGEFPLCLVEEFLTALCNTGKLTLHASCTYGQNSHHMAESLFKALGRALSEAFTPAAPGEGPQSTKGSL